MNVPKTYYPYLTPTMTHKQDIYIRAAKSAKIGIWQSDLVTNTVYWDSIIKLILELPEEYEPVFGDAIHFCTEGENRDRFIIKLEKAKTEGVFFSDKFQVTTASNKIKHVECICNVDTEDGVATRLWGTFQDITNEQNLINELELSVKKFSSVFSSANDAIVIIDSSTGIITDCNSRTNELTGYTTHELVGAHNSMLFPQNKRKEIRLFLSNQLKKDNHFVNETYIIDKFHQLVPVEVASGKKFVVENNTFLVCFLRDIIERKNVEENLNMLSLVASETSDSIVIANPKGETVWANNAFLELTGYQLPEIIGKQPRTFLNGPETDCCTINQIDEAIRHQQSLKTVVLNYNKQKEKFWYESTITPVFDKAGNCTKIIFVGRDITAAKVKEIELRRIVDVTNNQNDKLLNFAHIVSHNIRSHASNLSMILDVIENADDVDEKLSYIEMFKEGTDKLSETIEYLNEIITIQKNTSIEKKEINLKKEIEKVKRTLSQSIVESDIQITTSFPTTLQVNVIPAYLESIIFNLISNAIKYKSPHRRPLLNIGYEINEQYVVITFKDNGLGLNLNKNGHKIFGMYKTFHGNNDARGIGLYLTKNQIEAMNGKIEVESEEGVGSVFKIYLNEK